MPTRSDARAAPAAVVTRADRVSGSGAPSAELAAPTGSAAGLRLRWGLLVDPPMDGARNMARDHALAAALGEHEAALRIYRWSRPTVSVGRNEPALGRYGAPTGDFDLVRRPTGGRAVLHDRELTYAVALPLGAFGGPRRAYAAVSRALVRALRGLGVSAELAGDGAVPRPDAGPCFRSAAPGEVAVRGRKLVGSAQVRIGRTLLQHGSLLLAPGQERLDRLRPDGVMHDSRPTSLLEILGRVPPWELCARAVADGVAAELGGFGEGGAYESATIDRALEERLVERYRSDAWTWRR